MRKVRAQGLEPGLEGGRMSPEEGKGSRSCRGPSSSPSMEVLAAHFHTQGGLLREDRQLAVQLVSTRLPLGQEA